MVDPAVSGVDELALIYAASGLIKKNGGTISVLGPNGVPRSSYDFASNKANIVTALNECGKMLTDVGLTPALHQLMDLVLKPRMRYICGVLDARYAL